MTELLKFAFVLIACCNLACKKVEDKCVFADNVPDITYVLAMEEQNLCVFEDKSINIDAYMDSVLSYTWSPSGDTVSSITTNVSGVYTVNIVTTTSQLTFVTTIVSCGSLFIPNSFTPNSDGINDQFYALGSGIGCFYIEIRNKNGILVFISDDINKGWDGHLDDGTTKGNNVLPQGSYNWYIQARYVGNENISEFIGSVALIR